MKLVAQGSLCTRCQELQLGYMFGVDPECKGGNFLGPFWVDWVPGDYGLCELCDFFVECLPERDWRKVRDADGTWIVSTKHTSYPDVGELEEGEFWCYGPGNSEGSLGYMELRIIGKKNLWKLAAVSPIVCVPRGQLQTRELKALSPMLDLALVSGWLGKEEEEDVEQDCQYKENTSLRMALTVINCETRALVPLNNRDRYVTLSYVWGPVQPSSQDPDNDKVPLHLPDTIRDSIVVCNALNIKYLWVDRYCIPQKNNHIRSVQISQMDQIYRNSALTIVACAGEDPNYGLSGISRLRKPCPRIEVHGLGQLQSAFHPTEIIGSSV
ncbi:hypothetical protein G6011_07885 [Alternaria panax]|uniref:Heterokaryon incompatibility domain-containing protein n=1 Tax=Alternaria panax TaxID=48097 RepID=A0AAD4F9K9_9PLEO|nr:hypothetical protein G6011_07885 [Alternaria panax]